METIWECDGNTLATSNLKKKEKKRKKFRNNKPKLALT
jgi:hypothetical protein